MAARVSTLSSESDVYISVCAQMTDTTEKRDESLWKQGENKADRGVGKGRVGLWAQGGGKELRRWGGRKIRQGQDADALE